jgi:hypothetical protein
MSDHDDFGSFLVGFLVGGIQVQLQRFSHLNPVKKHAP